MDPPNNDKQERQQHGVPCSALPHEGRTRMPWLYLTFQHTKWPTLACLIQNCAENGNPSLAQVSTVQIYHQHFHFNAYTIVHGAGILELVPRCAMIEYLGTLRCLIVFIYTLLLCTLSQGIMWLALVRCQNLLILPLFN